jgi:hypothetical protein
MESLLKEGQDKIIQAIQLLDKAIQLPVWQLDLERGQPPRKFWGVRASKDLEEVVTKVMKKMNMIEDIDRAWIFYTTVGIVIYIVKWHGGKIYSLEEIVTKLKELGDYATKERVLQKFREELERLK